MRKCQGTRNKPHKTHTQENVFLCYNQSFAFLSVDRGRLCINAGKEGRARGEARADGGGGQKAGNEDRTQRRRRGWSQQHNLVIPLSVTEEK